MPTKTNTQSKIGPSRTLKPKTKIERNKVMSPEKSKKPSPVIYVAGLTCTSQMQDAVRQYYSERKHGSRSKFVVGINCGPETVAEEPAGGRYPSQECVQKMFTRLYPREFEIHLRRCLIFNYTEYKISAKEIAKAMELAGPNLDMLQLNTEWPTPASIQDVKERVQGKLPEFVLQVNREALSQIGDDPDCLVSKLQDYRGTVQRVLLCGDDPDGGHDGIEIEPFVDAVSRQLPEIGIVIGEAYNRDHGGVVPAHYSSFMKEYSGLGFHAEKELMDPSDRGSQIEAVQTTRFISAACKLFPGWKIRKGLD